MFAGMKKRFRDIVHFNRLNRDRWVAGIADQLEGGTRILDIGAGTCRYRHLFAHCQYETQDFMQFEGSEDGLFTYSDWSYDQIDYVCDATEIPVEKGSFDAVLCTEVLEHVPNPIMVLGEIARILKPGGKAFVTAPLGSGLHQEPYHFYGGFTPHFYREFLTEFGFNSIVVQPNGRFFRLLLQEIHRAVGIIGAQDRFGRPLRILLLGTILSWLLPLLSVLDDRIPVDEFTVGYFVEATKE
jgi:SAM-dependent methyltransferase